MRYTKYLAGLALAAGMLFPGAAALSAQDWRDLHHDYNRIDRMRDDMNRDQARLNEDIRCGRTEAAARDARDLARDQRAYYAQARDIQRDQYGRDSYGRGQYGRDQYRRDSNGRDQYGRDQYGRDAYRRDWR